MSIDLGEPAATVLDPSADDFKRQAGVLPDVQTQQPGVYVGPERVDVVQHQVLQLRAFRQESPECAVAEQVGNLEPVSYGVEALQRQVVRVVVATAGRLGPTDQCGMKTLAHFLSLLVQ